jgi:hypothetical protein
MKSLSFELCWRNHHRRSKSSYRTEFPCSRFLSSHCTHVGSLWGSGGTLGSSTRQRDPQTNPWVNSHGSINHQRLKLIDTVEYHTIAIRFLYYNIHNELKIQTIWRQISNLRFEVILATLIQGKETTVISPSFYLK